MHLSSLDGALEVINIGDTFMEDAYLLTTSTHKSPEDKSFHTLFMTIKNHQSFQIYTC
jgi:hypothetical protein